MNPAMWISCHTHTRGLAAREAKAYCGREKGLKHHHFNLDPQSQLQITALPLKRFSRRSGLDEPPLTP